LKNRSPHLVAVLQALFVTFLWSTSWVLIKLGLKEVPALTFAGLRYALAFLCLLPFAFAPTHRAILRALPRREWLRLAVFGLLIIAVTQGAQYVALSFLPAVTVSLLLSFTPALVALLGIVLLAERPTVLQWMGIGLYLVGVMVYFYPVFLPAAEVAGLVVAIIGVVTNAISAVMGRQINRQAHLPALLVTVVSMGFGSVALLGTGIVVSGIPVLSPLNWLFVVWLAVVNTAIAFPIWYHAQRTLSAVESSIINNTMLAQIAVLAWLFLGESLSWQQIVGMAMVLVGILVVQVRFAKKGLATGD
jgi:drug/metabolite transporter (DMT)-like permease